MIKKYLENLKELKENLKLLINTLWNIGIVMKTVIILSTSLLLKLIYNIMKNRSKRIR